MCIYIYTCIYIYIHVYIVFVYTLYMCIYVSRSSTVSFYVLSYLQAIVLTRQLPNWPSGRVAIQVSGTILTKLVPHS